LKAKLCQHKALNGVNFIVFVQGLGTMYSMPRVLVVQQIWKNCRFNERFDRLLFQNVVRIWPQL